MSTFGVSQSVARREDRRFITGAGAYVDDIAPRDALFAVFLRSQTAHAEIASIDTEAAREVPGVHLVVTGADLEAADIENHIWATLVGNTDGSKGADPRRPFLAVGRVRFVGEPVAMIVAESMKAARDAAELVAVEYDELPVHLAVAPGGPQINDEAPDNIAFDWSHGNAEAVEAAFADAAHVVSLEVGDQRVFANPMETRACFAEWDGARLHLCVGSQGVWGMRDRIARALKLDTSAVRVTTPDVGGGFGMKSFTYPEYYCVAEAARRLGRPVRWMAERSEAMLSDNAGRDLVSQVEGAFDADGKLLAYRVDTLSNLGAYNSSFGQNIQTMLALRVLTGTYDVQLAHARVRGIYTNLTQVDAYRGAGRPEAIYVLERLMDRAAREMGMDPFELRRRNFIPEGAFPYTTVAGETYDVGAFARVLGRAEEDADVAGFAARRAASEAAGKLRGMGLCYYIEAILGDPSETAHIVLAEDGGVDLYVGTQSNGQGHETVYAQFLHERTGLPFDKIRIVQGDSDRIAKGGGTGGSRSVTTQGNAINATADAMIAAFTPFVAAQMDAPEAEIAFADGVFRAPGRNLVLTLAEAGEAARAAGRHDLLEARETYKLPGRSFPNGAHVCEVEIDRDTGVVVVDRYTVVDDFGVLINPDLAIGQVHGGVAQGLGQALVEHVAVDETGQVLSASFMDYAMPRADIMPPIRFRSEPVPSTANPIGMKGCGEAGTVGALAAVANAVQDALWSEGVRQVDMPFTPDRVWALLAGQQTRDAAE